MRILQLGKFYPVSGGIEKVMVDLQQGLSQQGLICDMLCCHAEVGALRRVIEVAPNAHIICDKSLLKKFSTMFSIQMMVELRRICCNYDIIHVHHPDPMAAFALLLSGYKGKVVVHWHSDILSQRLLLQLYMPLQNWMLRRADVVVGTTPIYIQQSPHLQAVQEKCTYLPIGIRSVMWNDSEVAHIRAQYPGKKIIFSLGRLVYYKGFEYLIDAARQLLDDYMILIGGSGELKSKLQQQIDDNALSSKVKLLGRISDAELPNYFRACDLFCLSSVQKTEAFAIVQVEAMSCGRPVVATRIPESGVSWVNAHGISGVNVPVRDSGALAEAFVSILEDKTLYKRYSEGARHRFEQIFQFDEMIEKCLNIYRGLS